MPSPCCPGITHIGINKIAITIPVWVPRPKEHVSDFVPGSFKFKLKPIAQVIGRHASFTPPLLNLARWVADYYACGPGEVVAAAVPPMAWLESRRVVAITQPGLTERALVVLTTFVFVHEIPNSWLRDRAVRELFGHGIEPDHAWPLTRSAT